MNDQSNPFAAIELLKAEIKTLQAKIAHLCGYIDSHTTNTTQRDPVVHTVMTAFYHDTIANICSDVDAYVSKQHRPLKLLQPITKDTAQAIQQQLSQNLITWLENATPSNHSLTDIAAPAVGTGTGTGTTTTLTSGGSKASV